MQQLDSVRMAELVGREAPLTTPHASIPTWRRRSFLPCLTKIDPAPFLQIGLVER
jgi:hypothetical protein